MAVQDVYEIDFPKEGGSSGFTYSFDTCQGNKNVSFVKEQGAEWVEVDDSQAGKVIISATASPVSQIESWTKNVTIKVNNRECANFVVTREQGTECECNTALKPHNNQQNLPSNGSGDNDGMTLGTFEFEDYCIDMSYDVIVPQEASSWLTSVRINGTSVVGKVAENPGSQRETDLTISGEMKDTQQNCQQTIHVIQDGLGCQCGDNTFNAEGVAAFDKNAHENAVLGSYTASTDCVSSVVVTSVKVEGEDTTPTWLNNVNVITSTKKVSGDVSANDSVDARKTAVIKLTATLKNGQTCSKDIEVNQNGTGCQCGDSTFKITTASPIQKQSEGGDFEFSYIASDCITNMSDNVDIRYAEGSGTGWIRNITHDSTNKKFIGNILENQDFETRSATITISASIKGSTTKCTATVELIQQRTVCSCNELYKQIKQFIHALPTTGCTKLLVGSGNTNNCGTIEFISQCDKITAYTEPFEEDDSKYYIYADAEGVNPGDQVPRGCRFNLVINLKGSSEKITCENEAICLFQPENYCKCDDFIIEPITTQVPSRTYDAATRTFTVTIPKEGSLAIPQFLDTHLFNYSRKTSDVICANSIIEVDKPEDSSWCKIYNSGSDESYRRYAYVYVEYNSSAGPRGYTSTLRLMLMNEYESCEGNACGEEYHLNITQAGYGSCCDYTFGLTCPEEIIDPIEKDVYFEHSQYPYGCIENGNLYIYVYEYYDGYECSNMNEEYLLGKYEYKDTDGFVPIYKDDDKIWIEPGWYAASNIIFSVKANEDTENNRKAIIKYSIDGCEDSNCCVVEQSKAIGCSCDNGELKFRDGRTFVTYNYTICSHSNKYVGVDYNNEYCGENGVDYEVYENYNLDTKEFSNKVEDFSAYWFHPFNPSAIINGEFKYNIDANNTGEERCTYVKFTLKNALDKEDCYIVFKVCQEGVNTCGDLIKCTEYVAQYNDTSRAIAEMNSGCGYLSGSLVHTWSGSSAVYSQENEIDSSWVTRLEISRGDYYTTAIVYFTNNDLSTNRYVEYKLYLVDSNGNRIDDCEKNCVLTQYYYEETCLCNNLKVYFTPNDTYEITSDNLIKIPNIVFGDWQELGTIPLDEYHLCSRNYYCASNNNFSGIILYKIEYVDPGYGRDRKFVISYKIDEAANAAAAANGEHYIGEAEFVDAAFYINLKLSDTSDGIVNYIKETCVGEEQNCDNPMIGLRIYGRWTPPQ